MGQQETDIFYIFRDYQDDFKEVIFLCGLLSDDEAFRKKHGFSLEEYVIIRRTLTDSLRNISILIEEVLRKSFNKIAGLSVLCGILAAPVIGIPALFGIAGGIIGGGISDLPTSLGATVSVNKRDSEKVKKLLDNLKSKDDVVNKIVEELQERFARMRSAYENKTVKDWLDDGKQVAEWARGIAIDEDNRVYQVCSSIRVAQFAMRIAKFIQADFYAMQGVVIGKSVPGLSIFGRTLIAAGGTAARVLSGTFASSGISFGFWDIVKGASTGINGPLHIRAYRAAAKEIDKDTTRFENLRKEITKTGQA